METFVAVVLSATEAFEGVEAVEASLAPEPMLDGFPLTIVVGPRGSIGVLRDPEDPGVKNGVP